MSAIGYLRGDFLQPKYWPTQGVGCRITEHIEEDGLGKLVEEGDDGAAFGAEFLGLIQNRRNPPLLIQRRNWDTLPL